MAQVSARWPTGNGSRPGRCDPGSRNTLVHSRSGSEPWAKGVRARVGLHARVGPGWEPKNVGEGALVKLRSPRSSEQTGLDPPLRVRRRRNGSVRSRRLLPVVLADLAKMSAGVGRGAVGGSAATQRVASGAKVEVVAEETHVGCPARQVVEAAVQRERPAPVERPRRPGRRDRRGAGPNRRCARCSAGSGSARRGPRRPRAGSRASSSAEWLPIRRSRSPWCCSGATGQAGQRPIRTSSGPGLFGPGPGPKALRAR